MVFHQLSVPICFTYLSSGNGFCDTNRDLDLRNPWTANLYESSTLQGVICVQVKPEETVTGYEHL
jgi:hypothetical protein